MFVAAAAQGTSWGLWAAVAAVIVDSFVTCFVGWRLNRTARQEAVKAAETVKPALNDALTGAIVTLMPFLTETIKQHLAGKEAETSEQATRTIRSIGE